ncbi:hypothetical protein SAMN04515620_1342 [Collimonas sp. OK607]|nr:hypothetical protein SAMN04515620_1342 [Collimonas sp. OK607]
MRTANGKRITDTLNWAAHNPGEIHYNVKKRRDQATIMPNMIGFQSVVFLINERLKRTGVKATKVIVDRQSQFNQSQRDLMKFYSDVREIDMETGPGLPKWDLRNTPTMPIEIAGAGPNAGLELVDIQLWSFKRMLEERLPDNLLEKLVVPHLKQTLHDEISFEAIEQRWTSWFQKVTPPNQQNLPTIRQAMADDEERRLAVVRALI